MSDTPQYLVVYVDQIEEEKPVVAYCFFCTKELKDEFVLGLGSDEKSGHDITVIKGSFKKVESIMDRTESEI